MSTLTIDDQIQYYADLLAIQYRGLPKAQATVQALAREGLCNNLAIQVQQAYNIDPSLGPTAVGVQLDVIGKYAGVSRDVLTFSGGLTLDDEDFLTLVYLAISINNCNGSLSSIETILYQFFGGGITVFDNLDMSISYFFNAAVGSLPLLEAIVTLGKLPKPTGVALASLIYAVGLENYFAFGSYYQPWPASGISGFNSYYAATTEIVVGATHSNTTIDGITSTAALSVGNPISGPGIPLGTYIATISAHSITITQAATATASGQNFVSQPQAPWINVSDVISF